MSIRRIQLERLSNKVLTKLLQGGHFPTIQAFFGGLIKAIGRTILGSPLTKFFKIKRRSVSNPIALNYFLSTAVEDISSLYEESKNQVNDMLKDFDIKTTWRERIRLRLLAIKESLVKIIQPPPYVIQRLVRSSESINTNETDAFINLPEGAVQLNYHDSLSSKVDLRGSTATVVYSTSADVEVKSPIENLLDDNENTTWHSIVTSDRDVLGAEVRIELLKPSMVSRIELRPHSIDTTIIGVTVNQDSVLAKRQADISRTISWDIGPMLVSSVTIQMIKHKPDITIGASKKFHFGLQNISLLYLKYVPEAHITTTTHQFIESDKVLPIGSFRFQAQEEKPGATTTHWSYSFNGTEWLGLDPQGKHHVAFLQPEQTQTIAPTSWGFFDAKNRMLATAIDLSIADTTTNFKNLGVVGVVRGIDYWKVESYQYAFSERLSIPDQPPSLVDFLDLRGGLKNKLNTKGDILVRYQHRNSIEFPYYETTVEVDVLNFPTERTLHKFTAIINVSENISFLDLVALQHLSLNLAFPIFKDTFRTSVYVNESKVSISIQNSDSTASIPLKLNAGRNTITVVTNGFFLPANVTKLVDTSPLDPYIADGRITWQAEDESLTRGSLSELFFQTARSDNGRFALDGNFLVINHYPTVPYLVRYAERPSGTPNTLYLRATLQGDSKNPHITPRIYGYQLLMNYEKEA